MIVLHCRPPEGVPVAEVRASCTSNKEHFLLCHLERSSSMSALFSATLLWRCTAIPQRTNASALRAELDKAGISELFPFNLVHLLSRLLWQKDVLFFYSYVMYSLRSHLLRPTVCASEAEGSEPVPLCRFNFFCYEYIMRRADGPVEWRVYVVLRCALTPCAFM